MKLISYRNFFLEEPGDNHGVVEEPGGNHGVVEEPGGNHGVVAGPDGSRGYGQSTCTVDRYADRTDGFVWDGCDAGGAVADLCNNRANVAAQSRARWRSLPPSKTLLMLK